MIDLCEALYKIDEQGAAVSWGGVAQQARVRTTAQRLLEVIERGTSGITVFLAGDILGTLKDALAILTHPAVLAAFGSRTLGQVVVSIHRRLRLPAVTGFDEHRRRGQSGMTIVSWLAEAVPVLYGTRPVVGIDHPVVGAAVDWLEASLALTEPPAGAVSQPGSPYGAGSDWAALAS
jgi:hypothetical protein